MDPVISPHVLDAISELLNQRNAIYSARYFFLIGSSVISGIRNWESKDIDVYFYYYGDNPKKAKKHKSRFNSVFYNNLTLSLDIDCVESLTIDNYTDGNVSLTDYIFNEKRNELTVRLGRMNAITPEAYFLIRLPIRNKDKHNTVELIYEKLFDKTIPPLIREAMERFNLPSFP